MHGRRRGPIANMEVICFTAFKKDYFLGCVDDVEKILCESVILVNASNREGLTLKIQEAMTSRVLIIASHIRGNSGLIRQHQLFEVGDTCALTRLLVEFAENHRLRQQHLNYQETEVKHYDQNLVIKTFLY